MDTLLKFYFQSRPIILPGTLSQVPPLTRIVKGTISVPSRTLSCLIIYFCYRCFFSDVCIFSFLFWPSLWSSDQSSWLQIQWSEFDSQHNLVFWELEGLEWGPLSLVSTTEELFWRKCSGSGIENREYGCTDPSRWPLGTLYPQTLSLTSQTSSCARSV
jgi:hypothetical protein